MLFMFRSRAAVFFLLSKYLDAIRWIKMETIMLYKKRGKVLGK